jgi:PAS domain S-box-containing protein
MTEPAGMGSARLGYALAALMIVAAIVMLQRSNSNEVESFARVTRTHEVLQAITEVNYEVSRAGFAQRGYRVWLRDEFLAERDQANASAGRALVRLKALTVDNPAQQRRVVHLEGLISTFVAVMREDVLLARADTSGGDLIPPVTSGIQAASDSVHAVTADMREAELGLLQLRRADAEWWSRAGQGAGIFALILGLTVVILTYVGFLRQSRAREQAQLDLDRFFNLSLDLFGIAGRDGYFKRVNPAFSETLGHSTEELLARPFLEFVHPEDRAATLAEMERLNEGHRTTDFANRYQCKDGSWKVISWKVHPSAETGLLYATARDVTAHREMEAQLIAARDDAERANRAKGSFLATMSHEIRTPMNGVLGMLELLSLTELDAEQRTTVSVVRESGWSLLRIIDDILDFSKIEAGKLEVRPQVASVRESIDSVCRLFSGTASSKGLSIAVIHDPLISPAVLVDAVRLRQIVSNLVSNSLKFTSDGSIEVRTELIERANGVDRVRVTVKDTGIGISAEDQERLFQPFSQGAGQVGQRSGGTGLGLTICRRLVELMGGTIGMVSDPGKGTAVSLVLPMPIADAADLPREGHDDAGNAASPVVGARRVTPNAAIAAVQGTLVLVVDDHPTNRALLTRQLHALGYAAESAENGVNALQLWQLGRFGMVMTDCNMPEMDGYELAGRIRELEADSGGRRTPIIAFTANALAGTAERCLAAGMDDCLVKPASLLQLAEKLEQWLPHHGNAQDPPPPADLVAARVESDPVDPSTLRAISSGDAATERAILADFWRANSQDAALLRRAVSARDAAGITNATHRIIGAGRMVGALQLADACERIDQANRAGDWTAVATGLEAFDVEYGRLEASLDALGR